MKALSSFILGLSIFTMSAPVSAQDYPFEEWASLWQRTCGSLDAAYAVIEDPEGHGWTNANAEEDEIAARVIETATISAKASSEDARLTGLFVMRQSMGDNQGLAAFQELEFVGEPDSYLLACSIYHTNAPKLNVADLAKFSSERPYNDVSASGLTVIEWPESAEGSGRIKMTAGSIPQDHPGAALLLGGLVLKTQFVFSEE